MTDSTKFGKNMENSYRPFKSARDEVRIVEETTAVSPLTEAPAYRLAFRDDEFLLSEDLRPVRLQLELMKTEHGLRENGVRSTIAFFGSARILDRVTALEKLKQAEENARAHPSDMVLARAVGVARRMLDNSRYYEEAHQLAHIVSEAHGGSNECVNGDGSDFVVLTGGGPGIMEAANRGATEAGAKTIGLNIVLPFEQEPNPYVTPELCFNFHYFAIRKMHFLTRARALVYFPGGYGTLDELFEVLTLMQTGKIKRLPILMFGREFWTRVVNFHALAQEGMINAEDIDLFRYVETAEEAWDAIAQYYRQNPNGDEDTDVPSEPPPTS